MTTISEIVQTLEELAPPHLAEDWDNVGLLIGDRENELTAIMTCLTLTANVAAEAIARKAQLVISHHPLMFRPVQRLTSDSIEGRLLLELISNGIGVYSPHTGYDSARDGINQQLAEMLQLTEICPLRLTQPDDAQTNGGVAEGSGRCGSLSQPMPLEQLIGHVKAMLSVNHVQFVGDESRIIHRVGIACGSAAEFLQDAHRNDCEVLLTGEARFHACLEAESIGTAMILPGHYATERPAMERMADMLATRFGNLTVWASESEFDPVQWA